MPLSDDVAVLLDRSERLDDAMFGNGRRGLIAEVAALKQGQTDHEKTEHSPTRRAVAGGAAGVVALVVAFGRAAWDSFA